MGKQFSAIVYAAESLLHRGSIVSDDANEFLQACSLASEGGKYRILNATDLKIKHLPPWDIETMNRAIAQHEGVAVESLPSGRCAVVDPQTRQAVEFIVADTTIHALASDHQHGARELRASDTAKLNWKHDGGVWKARVVRGDANGVVRAVTWVIPEAIPADCVECSHAQIGDVVEGLKRHQVDMGVKAEKF